MRPFRRTMGEEVESINEMTEVVFTFRRIMGEEVESIDEITEVVSCELPEVVNY